MAGIFSRTSKASGPKNRQIEISIRQLGVGHTVPDGERHVSSDILCFPLRGTSVREIGKSRFRWNFRNNFKMGNMGIPKIAGGMGCALKLQRLRAPKSGSRHIALRLIGGHTVPDGKWGILTSEILDVRGGAAIRGIGKSRLRATMSYNF